MVTERKADKLADRFVGADGPHLIEEHDPSEDAKDHSFKH